MIGSWNGPPHPKVSLLDWTVETIWVLNSKLIAMFRIMLCDYAVSNRKHPEIIRVWHSQAVTFKRCSADKKENRKILPAPLRQQPESRGHKINPCFHVLYKDFWNCHLNDAAEIETQLTRQHFFHLLLSIFDDSLVVASVSGSADNSWSGLLLL